MLPNSTAAARRRTPSRRRPSPRSRSGWFSTYRLLQSPPSYRLRYCSANLSSIQIVHRPLDGGLVLPTLLAVHPLEEHSVVFVGGHGEGSVPDAAVGGAAVSVRPRRSLARADYNDFTAAVHRDPLDRWKRRRVDLPELGAQLLDGALADLLSDDYSIRRYAKQHLPAALVQEGTDGPWPPLGGSQSSP